MSDPGLRTRDCPAKINLFLEVRSRRADGYHEIDTVLQTVGLFDRLFARPVDGPELSLTVHGADLPTDRGNLVIRAAERFREGTGREDGVALRLDKGIPVQAGLGGGSSDAAGTLILLRDLFAPDLPDRQLEAWAADLGSDVPFFVRGGRARATGRGENIRRLSPAEPRWLVLFRPDFGLSTPEVYRRVVVPDAPEDASSYLEGGRVFNRLAAAAEAHDPAVVEFRDRISELLTGEERAILSGSGSVFFVLVGDVHRAASLASAFNRGAGTEHAYAVRTLG